MLKKIYLALAIFAGLLSPAYSAGTISFSLSQQFGADGKPLAGCKLYFFAAGTSTPQIAYQDTALTLPVPGGSQLTCDASGRLPQFFLADGLIKVRLTDKNGVNQAYPNGSAALDNILVIGPSSGGGGGGGTVDPTTIMATGDVKSRYGTGVLTGFVRMNGRTVGSATSGATERANADTQALFEYLWQSDANLVVSTGRGVSANADWVANKSIALPDGRGRALAALDDMGNSAAGRLTATYWGSTGGCSAVLGTVLGAACGGETTQLTTAGQLPNVNFAVTDPGHVHTYTSFVTGTSINNGSGSVTNNLLQGTNPVQTASATTGITVNSGGSSTPFKSAFPSILITNYIKL